MWAHIMERYFSGDTFCCIFTATQNWYSQSQILIISKRLKVYQLIHCIAKNMWTLWSLLLSLLKWQIPLLKQFYQFGVFMSWLSGTHNWPQPHPTTSGKQECWLWPSSLLDRPTDLVAEESKILQPGFKIWCWMF